MDGELLVVWRERLVNEADDGYGHFNVVCLKATMAIATLRHLARRHKPMGPMMATLLQRKRMLTWLASQQNSLKIPSGQ